MQLTAYTLAFSIILATQSLAALASLAASPPKGTAKLKNFAPGKYELIEGDNKSCEFDTLEYYTGQKNTIVIGPHHLFNTVPDKGQDESDIPEEAGCLYISEDLVDVNSGETTLTFHEVFQCKQGKKYGLTEMAVLTPQKVVLSVRSESPDDEDMSFEYRCVWKKSKGKSKPRAKVVTKPETPLETDAEDDDEQ
jgi:hypothetical protein